MLISMKSFVRFGLLLEPLDLHSLFDILASFPTHQEAHKQDSCTLSCCSVNGTKLKTESHGADALGLCSRIISICLGD